MRRAVLVLMLAIAPCMGLADEHRGSGGKIAAMERGHDADPG